MDTGETLGGFLLVVVWWHEFLRRVPLFGIRSSQAIPDSIEICFRRFEKGFGRRPQ
jgi:hypothetical protein